MRAHNHSIGFFDAKPADNVGSINAFDLLLHQRLSIAAGFPEQLFQL